MSRISYLRLSIALAQVVTVGLVATAAEAGPGARHDKARQAQGTFEVVNFAIEPYHEMPNGATLSRFHADDVFRGDLQGTGAAEAYMFSRADGTTNDAGYIYVIGELGGRSGSFVIETVGESDGQTASNRWTILPGSGTGGLSGLRGQGGETAVNNDGTWVANYRLTYYFR